MIILGIVLRSCAVRAALLRGHDQAASSHLHRGLPCLPGPLGCPAISGDEGLEDNEEIARGHSNTPKNSGGYSNTPTIHNFFECWLLAMLYVLVLGAMSQRKAAGSCFDEIKTLLQVVLISGESGAGKMLA